MLQGLQVASALLYGYNFTAAGSLAKVIPIERGKWQLSVD